MSRLGWGCFLAEVSDSASSGPSYAFSASSLAKFPNGPPTLVVLNPFWLFSEPLICPVSIHLAIPLVLPAFLILTLLHSEPPLEGLPPAVGMMIRLQGALLTSGLVPSSTEQLHSPHSPTARLLDTILFFLPVRRICLSFQRQNWVADLFLPPFLPFLFCFFFVKTFRFYSLRKCELCNCSYS